MSNTFQRSLIQQPKLSESPYSRPEFAKKNPIAQAVINKLVSGQIPQRVGPRGNREINTPSEQLVRRISDNTATNITDSSAMMQLLPETKMAMNILVSSIISPNDMIGNELHFSVDNCELPSEMSAAMLKVIENYFGKVYKIERRLKPILEDILFKKGAFPQIIIPESSIDELINGPSISNESFNDALRSSQVPIGILGNGKARTGVSTEAMQIDITKTNAGGIIVEVDKKPLLTVTDNPNVIKSAALRKRLVDDRADVMVRGGGISHAEIESALYKRRQYSYNATQAVKTTDMCSRPTVGHPMVINAPMESVIPVHVPGDPSDHVGYFLLLDRTGNPINQSEYLNFFNEMSLNTSANREQVSQLLSAARTQAIGASTTQFSVIDKESAVNTYQEMIESDLMERLRTGVYGDDVAVSGSSEVYRIMLARGLAKQQTQLLYIPRSLVSYMAFDYNCWGVGKSLVEDTKILGSIRAMLLFANTMAEIKNSVGHENVAIELDPNDPDPSRTVEFLFHEYAKNRQSRYPVGATNPLDLVNYLQNAGVQLTVSGHEGYPVTKLDVNSVQTNRTLVDNDLNDRLKKQHLLAWGVPPETVDAANGADFAATVVRNNLLFTKTITDYQMLFTEQLADFVRKYTMNSSILMDELKEAAKEHSKTLTPEQAQRYADPVNCLVDFLGSFVIGLPTPDTVKIQSQMDAFNVYTELLDKALEAYFNSSFFNSEMLGENIGASIDSTKEAVKAYYLRRWLNENNVLPELNDLVNWSDEGPAVNILSNYENLLEGLTKSLGDFMRKVNVRKEAADMAVPESDSGTDTADVDNESTDEFGIDEDLGGDDDLGDTPSEADADTAEDSGTVDSETDSGETPDSESEITL